MTKINKRRIISSVTALAIVLNFGTISALDAYYTQSAQNYDIINCDHVEELPDGGQIYYYNIDGVESSFPVPPEGFDPLSASDEMLETYGFPPRPDEENSSDYNDWTELMSCYKFTPTPDAGIKVISRNDNEVSTLSASDRLHVTDVAGYGAESNGTQFFTQAQVDYQQPKVIDAKGNSANEFFVRFGGLYQNYGRESFIKTGTKNYGKSDADAFCEFNNASGETKEVPLGMNVKSGDNIHIYVSFQKANNKFNYYIANNTTGAVVLNTITPPIAGCFDGTCAIWGTGRVHNSEGISGGLYSLGQCSTVTMKNCKAMINTSNDWTDLNKLNPQRLDIYSIAADHDQLYSPGSISNSNCFSLIWLKKD